MGTWLKRSVWLTLVAMMFGCSSDNPADKLGFDIEILNEEGLSAACGRLIMNSVFPSRSMRGIPPIRSSTFVESRLPSVMLVYPR